MSLDIELKSIKQIVYNSLSQMSPEEIARSICYAEDNSSQFIVLNWLSEQTSKLQSEVRRYTKNSSILEIIKLNHHPNKPNQY